MKIAKFVAALATVLLLPALALASGDAEGHDGPLDLKHVLTDTSFLASVINFGLLLFVLKKLAGKPFAEFLSTRRSEMEQAIRDAGAMKEKAEARYKEYTERLGTLDQELKKLKNDIARGAEEDKQQIMASAEEATKRLKVETESLIEQHAQALHNSVRREVVEAALAAAEEVLTKQIGAHDQQRLADDFKQHVAATPGKQSGTQERA